MTKYIFIVLSNMAFGLVALQAQAKAVPKAPKAPADTPPRPPEEDTPPADKSSEPPPNKPANSGKKKSGNNQEAE